MDASSSSVRICSNHDLGVAQQWKGGGSNFYLGINKEKSLKLFKNNLPRKPVT